MMFLFSNIENYILLFFVSMIVMSIWELLVGIFLEKVFKTKYWDYSDCKFNIGGYVCLKNSFYWGILAIVLLKFIHPFVEEKLSIIPQEILLYASIALLIASTIDAVFTIIKLNKINIGLAYFSELSESIKEKLEQIKEMSEKKLNTQILQEVVEDLKLKQKELREKIEKRTRRLLAVFPKIKSENFTKYLSERYKNIKEEIKSRIEEK